VKCVTAIYTNSGDGTQPPRSAHSDLTLRVLDRIPYLGDTEGWENASSAGSYEIAPKRLDTWHEVSRTGRPGRLTQITAREPL
jgi:hypothetical protein